MVYEARMSVPADSNHTTDTNCNNSHSDHNTVIENPATTPTSIQTDVHSNIHNDEVLQEPEKQSFCQSLRRDTHWKCLILTLLISGCLAAIIWCRLTQVARVVISLYSIPVTRQGRASPCEDGYIYIPVAFVAMLYLVYLVECWHCHTRIQLQYKVDVNTVYNHVHSMQDATPVVWWKALCYHYVRRTRQVTRYRNGDAFTTTQVYYERINSHTTSSAFNFVHCGVKDVSKKLVNLEKYPATKIKFSKGFSFACSEAEHEFQSQRLQFFQDHERRDDYMETKEGLDLLNVTFKEYMIAFADPDHLPWYVSNIIFWLFSFLMLSWPLRVLIQHKTAYVHYCVHKVFGCNYTDVASSSYAGQMSRVSTMGSSDIELTIRNNYTMVPSYSEALLMDSATQQQDGNITPNGSIPMVPLGASLNGQIPKSVTRTLIITNGHAGAHALDTTSNSSNSLFQRLGRSTDNLHLPWASNRRKKKKRRRHSFSFSESSTGENVHTRDSYPSYGAVGHRSMAYGSVGPPDTLHEHVATEVNASSMEGLESVAHALEHNSPYRDRVTDTLEHNSPYRRREAGKVRQPGQRCEVSSNLATLPHSRSAGTLGQPEHPPCYEEALVMTEPVSMTDPLQSSDPTNYTSAAMASPNYTQLAISSSSHSASIPSPNYTSTAIPSPNYTSTAIASLNYTPTAISSPNYTSTVISPSGIITSPVTTSNHSSAITANSSPLIARRLPSMTFWSSSATTNDDNSDPSSHVPMETSL